MKNFNSFYKSTSERKFNTWCNYTNRLDTYGCGCQHNCSYCYAKSLLSFRGLWDEKQPLIANIGDIYKTIVKIPRDQVVKLGGMTDCFQPLEKQHKITYQTIKLLNKFRINYLIVTKSNLVSHPNYMEIYDKDLSHFQVTITGTNKYENASTTAQRIESIEELQRNGFDVSVRLSPFIEQFIDYSVLNLIKCDKILIEFLKVNHWVKKWFDIDYSDYMVVYGGYRHLPLFKKQSLLKNINGFSQVSIGEYVREHYDYFSNNINYNKNDCCNLTLNLPVIPKYTQLQLF